MSIYKWILRRRFAKSRRRVEAYKKWMKKEKAIQKGTLKILENL